MLKIGLEYIVFEADSENHIETRFRANFVAVFGLFGSWYFWCCKPTGPTDGQP